LGPLFGSSGERCAGEIDREAYGWTNFCALCWPTGISVVDFRKVTHSHRPLMGHHTQAFSGLYSGSFIHLFKNQGLSQAYFSYQIG
jgi:hypothetical protein